MTRTGVDRVVKFAFELARSRPKKHLTSATKSNGISITMPYWDERVEAMAKNFPDVRWDKYHIDILTANFVLQSGLVQRGGRLEPVRRYSFRPWPRLHRHHRHRAERQYQPRGQIPFRVRAGARLGARYRRPGHRQSDRADLVGRHDAGAPWRKGSRPRHRQRHRARTGGADACAPAISAAMPTRSPAARRWRMRWGRSGMLAF